jgi:hypothetical protein
MGEHAAQGRYLFMRHRGGKHVRLVLVFSEHIHRTMSWLKRLTAATVSSRRPAERASQRSGCAF